MKHHPWLCADCLKNGKEVEALAFWNGFSLCVQHVVAREQAADADAHPSSGPSPEEARLP